MKRPVHVSLVLAATLASLTGCRQLGRLGRGEGDGPDRAPHSRSAGEHRRGGRERSASIDELSHGEAAYRELMRSRARERSHQRALDRDFASELYESAIADWP